MNDGAWKPRLFILLLRFSLSDEMYGDFEDLETGEVHSGQPAQKDPSEVEADLLPFTD